MTQPAIFFAEVNERQGLFHRRAILLGAFAGIGISALGARLAYLQLFQTQRYEKLAVSNQFNFKLAPAPRGVIVDRNGAVLAANRPNFRLMVARDKGSDTEGVLKSLANFVPLDDARQRRLLKDIHNAPKRAPVPVMEDMSWEQFSAINVRAPELPGVTADVGEVRVYPHGGAFAHVIGYVAKVNREDIDDTPNPEPIMLHPGFRIGKQGVEKALDAALRGRAGAHKVEVDANGREVGHDVDGDIPAVPGDEVQLTLDVDIQNRALEVFGEESGGAVMMDCRNGDILCMSSAPSFDANRFVRGLTGPEYRALAGYERKPLLDKCLTGLYPPGSTFKTMTALAILNAGIDPEARVSCGGGMNFGGRYFHCHKRGGHGSQNLHEAIKNSCDTYFYSMSLRVGPDRIAQAARAFGLGQTFDIGIPGQKKGTVPDPAWKKRYFSKNEAQQPWWPGENLSYAIGQGYLQVNALQLAVMTARLANGLKALNPRLIKSVGGKERPKGSDGPDLPFPTDHIERVRAGMAAVTDQAQGGTAWRNSQLGLGDILMAGKTGTAQVRNYDSGGSRGKGGTWGLRDHGLFVAFAPIDAPRYAIAVIVQHGMGGGAAAAPRAREIMRTALLKDPELMSRIQKPVPMPPLVADPELDTVPAVSNVERPV
ncbi:MAG: penicillin-binding protein 2 [Alphaproteobacteria bacterium]|nr:penicillin-binding protein 2 [Alphaproteobacteria bacterium]MBU1512983.1 penicillin-binding protein 2 [Alphaproteobacteria bacterium]MBU2094843.1 penicillin-binding protein 2 [Alphaproteobacteria bacterium]MBU2152749.1 penicillin-binding protein 2 [Alphaproteobacteria bacterium]MBU2306342.1 penicillin-binding protein 2 [Alphaproteobacteria bacterium]